MWFLLYYFEKLGNAGGGGWGGEGGEARLIRGMSRPLPHLWRVAGGGKGRRFAERVPLIGPYF